MSASLLLVNTIITGNGPISLPTKGTWSNNTIPFVLNFFPTQLTGTGLVSKTALDYFTPDSFILNTPRIPYVSAVNNVTLLQKQNGVLIL